MVKTADNRFHHVFNRCRVFAAHALEARLRELPAVNIFWAWVGDVLYNPFGVQHEHVGRLHLPKHLFQSLRCIRAHVALAAITKLVELRNLNAAREESSRLCPHCEFFLHRLIRHGCHRRQLGTLPEETATHLGDHFVHKWLVLGVQPLKTRLCELPTINAARPWIANVLDNLRAVGHQLGARLNLSKHRAHRFGLAKGHVGFATWTLTWRPLYARFQKPGPLCPHKRFLWCQRANRLFAEQTAAYRAHHRLNVHGVFWVPSLEITLREPSSTKA